jgi:hypothetical protein
MAEIELSQLTQLDGEKVRELLDQLSAQLTELNPDLDLRRGVFHDTVAYLHAVLETAIRTNLDRYLTAKSLQLIASEPDLADPEIVDAVLSNWGVFRSAGVAPRGTIVIELNAARIVTVPQNFEFEADGYIYRAIITYVSQISPEAVVNEGDRLLQLLDNGRYAFTIEVESDSTDRGAQLQRNKLVVPQRSISGYVTSYAADTFSAGVSPQTNRELISSLQTGIAGKTPSNRITLGAWLRSYDEFSDIVRLSVIGYGDSEMTRDQHSIFPVSYGGRVDAYVRTRNQLEYRTVDVTASLLSKTTQSSLWQFFIPADAFPGFYEIHSIAKPETSSLNFGFEAASEVRNFAAASGFSPDIASSAEAAYSAYQIATVQFTDNVTPPLPLVVGQTAVYKCVLKGLPLIADMQQRANERDVRHIASDLLIKAPVPCFVRISFQLNEVLGNAPVDLDRVRLALVDQVHSVGFTGRLDGSLLLDTIHDAAGRDVSVTDFHMVGRIRRPAGDNYFLQSVDSLQVPDQPKLFVSPKTVQFFLDPEDVGISINTLPVPTSP